MASDGSGSTRVLPRDAPFDMRLALELKQDTSPLAFPLACHIAVRARRLGSGDGGIVVGEARQSIPSSTRTVSLCCKGAPLSGGLYRLDATAALRGSDGTSAPAFLAGTLVSVS
jgi:hypothetical protein